MLFGWSRTTTDLAGVDDSTGDTDTGIMFICFPFFEEENDDEEYDDEGATSSSILINGVVAVVTVVLAVDKDTR